MFGDSHYFEREGGYHAGTLTMLRLTAEKVCRSLDDEPGNHVESQQSPKEPKEEPEMAALQEREKLGQNGCSPRLRPHEHAMHKQTPHNW